MKQPVNPEVFKARQSRNDDMVQLVAALLGLVAITSVTVVAFLFAWGNLAAVIAVGTLAILIGFIPAAACFVGVMESGSSIVHRSRRIRRTLNEQAWNAQQEELDRLRTIMKEEGL